MNNPGPFDVYVRSIKKLYSPVPFSVVAEWLQQGRLTANDAIRPVGTQAWRATGSVAEFQPYVPRAAPARVEDRAEAVEPIELEFAARRVVEEEEDPDMIPLIDISLVLLVFFMMTASGMVTTSPIETPPAEYANVVAPKEALTLGVTRTDSGVQYYVGDKLVSEQELLAEVEQRMKDNTLSEAVIKAHPDTPFEVVQSLLANLESRGVQRVEAGVRDHRRAER